MHTCSVVTLTCATFLSSMLGVLFDIAHKSWLAELVAAWLLCNTSLHNSILYKQSVMCQNLSESSP